MPLAKALFRCRQAAGVTPSLVTSEVKHTETHLLSILEPGQSLTAHVKTLNYEPLNSCHLSPLPPQSPAAAHSRAEL